jgi:O-antigen/teichoic acid export membrane protein
MTSPKNENLAKKFVLYSFGPWASAFISFITTPLTTWLIAPEEFGKASMYTLAYSLLMFSALLGVDQSYIRFFYNANEPEKRALLRRSVTTSLSVGAVHSLCE